MKTMRVLLAACLVGVALGGAVARTGTKHGDCKTDWQASYVGDANTSVMTAGENKLYDYADAKWTDYPVCAAGKHQSPIDLPAFAGMDAPAAATKLVTSYTDFAANSLIFKNTGNGVQVQTADGSIMGTATYDGKTYNAVQYHIHFPSEHIIAGVQQAGELHIVHSEATATGYDDLLVVGFFFEDDGGNDNAWLNKIGWGSIGTVVGDELTSDAALTANDECKITTGPNNLNDFAATSGEFTNFWRYEGSLTTPPCTESVHWFVSSDVTIKVSTAQINAYDNRIHDSDRTVNDLNNRKVFKNQVVLTEAEAFTDGVRCVDDKIPATRACDDKVAESPDAGGSTIGSGESPAFGLATGVAIVLSLLF